jgi:hypothetical protein
VGDSLKGERAMYSAHGWASIWPSYKNDDSADDLLDTDKMDALREKIGDYIKQLGLERMERANGFAEVGYLKRLTYTNNSSDAARQS